MRTVASIPGTLPDVSVAHIFARYREIRRVLTPFYIVSLAAMLVLAVVGEPGEVVMALFIIPVVFAVRSRLARDPRDGEFLADIFLWGFLLRALLGLVIFHFDLWDFYGGDSVTYDYFGWELTEVWHGRMFMNVSLDKALAGSPHPGIIYLTAAFYYVVGHYLLFLQFVLSVIGAVTPIVIVRIADTLFGDREVSRLSGLIVAFFPSLVMWSCQLMKEGLILFFLAVVVYSMQQSMGSRFRLRYPIYVVGALVALRFLRFYIFYVMAAALALALVGPARGSSPLRFLRRLTVGGLVLAGATYFVGPQELMDTFEHHTKLEMINEARWDQSRTARSGFMLESDVSNLEGVQQHLPFGFLYLMFGPFPWEVKNIRQLLGLFEGVLWWMMVPACLRGLWLAVRHRLPESLLMLLFCAGVTLAYSIGQGNVGTAYRQRVQVQIFLFILVAMGYVWKKRRRLRASVRRTRLKPVPTT